MRKKICFTGPTRAAKAGQKSLVQARRAQRTYQGRTTVICTPWVPICLSFNSQQGPPLSGLSGCLYSVVDLIYKIRNRIRILTQEYEFRTSFMIKICRQFRTKNKILFLVNENDIYFFMDLHEWFQSAGRSLKWEHPALLNKKQSFFFFFKAIFPILDPNPLPWWIRILSVSGSNHYY